MRAIHVAVVALLSSAFILTGSPAGAAGPATPAAASSSMKITMFHATAAGESRFREIDIPFVHEREDGFGAVLRLSEPYASPSVQFVTLPASLDQDWHNAPARQIVVVLEGTIEVETTDGERRRWTAGEVFLPADVSGRGHRTRAVDGAVRLLFAPLPDDFEIDGWGG